MPSTNTTTTEIYSEIDASGKHETPSAIDTLSPAGSVDNHYGVFSEEWYEYDDEGFIPIVCALSDVNTVGSHAYTN